MVESGFISWPSGAPVWEFSYFLDDAVAPEGIVIRNVRLRGRTVLYKANLPSLRVNTTVAAAPTRIPSTSA